MKGFTCDKCGGNDLIYVEKLESFKCKKCSKLFRNPEWSKELQDKRIVDTTLGHKGKKPVVINTGSGSVTVTFEDQSKLARVGHWVRIVAALITIGGFIWGVSNFIISHDAPYIADVADLQIQYTTGEEDLLYADVQMIFTDAIRPMPEGFFYEIRFRLNDNTDRVNIQRFDIDQELLAHNLFLIWDEELGDYVGDTSRIDRFDVGRTTRIYRTAWTPIGQIDISYHPGDPGLTLQIGDTIRDLWYSSDWHHYFVRGSGFNYILNVYAYWVWSPDVATPSPEYTTEYGIRPMPEGFIFDIRLRLNDDTGYVNIRRHDRHHELTPEDLFMTVENDELVFDTSRIDRFSTDRNHRVYLNAWTPIRQTEVALYFEDTGQYGRRLKVGDTLYQLWHDPDFHHFFVRGAGFNYILNMYAVWSWEPPPRNQ